MRSAEAIHELCEVSQLSQRAVDSDVRLQSPFIPPFLIYLINYIDQRKRSRAHLLVVVSGVFLLKMKKKKR